MNTFGLVLHWSLNLSFSGCHKVHKKGEDKRWARSYSHTQRNWDHDSSVPSTYNHNLWRYVKKGYSFTLISVVALHIRRMQFLWQETGYLGKDPSSSVIVWFQNLVTQVFLWWRGTLGYISSDGQSIVQMIVSLVSVTKWTCVWSCSLWKQGQNCDCDGVCQSRRPVWLHLWQAKLLRTGSQTLFQANSVSCPLLSPGKTFLFMACHTAN